MPNTIGVSQEMFSGCTALEAIKNFKWNVEALSAEIPNNGEIHSVVAGITYMSNIFQGCSSLSHIYYNADNDPSVQRDSDEWLLYKKTGNTLTAYDTDGEQEFTETLGENKITLIGQTVDLLFDTQVPDHEKKIQHPYLYALNDGSTFDAAGGSYALLAKDPEKVVTNIERFRKLSASKKLAIPLSEPSPEDMVPGCIWLG